MGNTISTKTYDEYKNKIEHLEKRVLELEQKVFLNYDNIDGKLIKSNNKNKYNCDNHNPNYIVNE